jgi:hypothetical protein
MNRISTMRTHIGRVVAHPRTEGTTDHFFIPIDAPGRRMTLVRSSQENPAGEPIDLRRYQGRLVSVLGVREADRITNVLSIQASPERPAVARTTSPESQLTSA